MEIIKRKADLKKDGEILLKIDNESFRENYHNPSKDVREEIGFLRNSDTFIYYDRDKPAGLLAFEDKDGIVGLKSIAVIPSYQGRGIGGMMVRDFIKFNDDKELSIMTHPKNTPAIILYLRNGFQIVEWISNYYGDGEPRLKFSRL